MDVSERERSSAARPARRPRGGGSLVEMILVLPVLLMLSLGACEYGYFVYAKQCFQGAARDAVRAATLPTADDAKVAAAALRSLQVAGLHNTQYTVTTSPSTVVGLTTGTPVTVTVSCDWQRVGVHPLPTWLGGIGPTKKVKGAAVMSRE